MLDNEKQQHPTGMQLMRLLLLVGALAILGQLQEADAQFFTKSSKSIPRMGRRSLQDQSSASTSAVYRRALLDRLLDEYGPNLVEALQARAAMESSREFASRNEQPIDVTDISSLVGGGGGQDDPESGSMSRNERSPTGSQRDASLAMRALTANRLLQALSSGQPLMSYDKIYSSGRSSSERQDNLDPAKFAGDK